jgi:hypothetical protein
LDIPVEGSTTRTLRTSTAASIPLSKVLARKMRVMEDDEEESSVPTRKRSLGVSRRLLSPNGIGINPEKRLKVSREGEKGRVTVDPILEQMAISTKNKEQQRQLRSYAKLPDTEMTDSTFRVYVEKHINDNCSQSSAAYLGNSKKGSQHLYEPPAFSLRYLERVTALRMHAQRTVEVATKRRLEKRKRQDQKSSTATGASLLHRKAMLNSSTESVDEKMQRLYASVIRAMLMDGIIVLALPNLPVMRPFDGNRPDVEQSGMYPYLDWETAANSATSARSTSTSTRGGLMPGEDAYQVVTPSLLARPLFKVMKRPTSTLTSLQLVEKMQIIDDRWRYLRQESVEETLQYIQGRKGTI